MEPLLIEKEIIKDLTFKLPFDLEQPEDIHHKLEEATRLGNGYRTKVSIIFKDDEGLKKVNTTVWAKGQKFICLKGGMWIPINHIVDLKF
ncbi:MAG: hypothetical protein ACK46Y_16625 [Fluviicola sp.]|jgi:hypothetical protein